MGKVRTITIIVAVAALAYVLSGVSACPHVRGEGQAQALQTRALTRVPALREFIDGVTRARLERIVNELSGETSSVIGGAAQTIRTRFIKAGRQSDLAEQYVYEHLRAYGLSNVTYQSFQRGGVTYRNVIGEIPGGSRADEILLVGPHLDSKAATEEQSMTLAPGADDNASGVAAALVMAKLLSGQKFERTIRFVFFDGEETDYHEGSMYYAKSAREAGDDIVAMVSPDMFAYNDGSKVIGLHTRKRGVDGEVQGQALAQQYSSIVSTYGITSIRPVAVADGSTASDHASFWFNGYPAAVLLSQDFDQINHATHTADDRVSNFDWPYYVGAAKGLLGLIATRAGFVATSLHASVSGARNGAWYRAPVDVKLTAAAPSDGPAVASITYSLDGAGEVTVPGRVATLTLPGAGAADGAHRLVYHATDVGGNSETGHTLRVNLDTVRPDTRAPPAVRVRRHATATFTFRVDDPSPNGGTARVRIKIRDAAGQVVKRSPIRKRKVNSSQAIALSVSLPKGRYRFTVEAWDTAGNRQSGTGGAILVVR